MYLTTSQHCQCVWVCPSQTPYLGQAEPPPPRNKQTKTNYYYLYLQVATSWSLLQCVAKLFTYMLTITTWRFSVLAAVFISFWLTTSLHSNHFPLPTQTWLSLAKSELAIPSHFPLLFAKIILTYAVSPTWYLHLSSPGYCPSNSKKGGGVVLEDPEDIVSR